MLIPMSFPPVLFSNVCFAFYLLVVHSFLGLVRYMFSLPEIKRNNIAFLSQHLCQDPLEKFFGCQRQRGGTSDNPNALEYYRNTQALRVINSFCRGPVKGNCRGSQDTNEQENTPLSRKCTKRK